MKLHEITSEKTPNARSLPGYDHTNPLHASWSRIFSRQKYEAGRRGLSFNATIQQCWDLINKQQWKCALTGVSFVPGGSRNDLQPSLDRINSSVGYDPGNLQYVTYRVNLIKREMPESEFIMLCKQVANYR